MMDSTHLKAHRTASGLRKRDGQPRRIGTAEGGLNSKHHAACDAQGKPIILLLKEDQMGDDTGACLLLCKPSTDSALIGDPGYGSNHLRGALSGREPSIFDPTVYDWAKANLPWETTKCCLSQIINNVEALSDVWEGSRTCSQDELFDMVHRLAGSAATFGF